MGTAYESCFPRPCGTRLSLFLPHSTMLMRVAWAIAIGLAFIVLFAHQDRCIDPKYGLLVCFPAYAVCLCAKLEKSGGSTPATPEIETNYNHSGCSGNGRCSFWGIAIPFRARVCSRLRDCASCCRLRTAPSIPVFHTCVPNFFFKEQLVRLPFADSYPNSAGFSFSSKSTLRLRASAHHMRTYEPAAEPGVDV